MDIKKPLSVARQELIDALANDINTSSLPPFVVEPILNNFVNETRVAMHHQYEEEKKQYYEMLKQSEQK